MYRQADKDASIGIALQTLVTLLKMLGIAAPRWALQHMALNLTRWPPASVPDATFMLSLLKPPVAYW